MTVPKPFRLLVPVAALMVVGPIAEARGSDMTGKWVAWVFGTKIRAQVHYNKGEISGRAIVMPPFGKRNYYDFVGRVYPDGRVVATHFRGHLFKGRLKSPNRVVGKLKTSKGVIFDIEAKRQ